MLLSLLIAAAHATSCVVDLQQALEQTAHGQRVQAGLEAEYERRKQLIEEAQRVFTDRIQAVESGPMRAVEQRRLLEAELFEQQQLQQLMLTQEEELAALVESELAALMAVIQETVAVVAEREDCVLVGRAAVVYAAPTVVDLTEALIAAHNTAHP